MNAQVQRTETFEQRLDLLRGGLAEPFTTAYAWKARERMIGRLSRYARSRPNIFRVQDFDDVTQGAWLTFKEKVDRPADYNGLDFELRGLLFRRFVKGLPLFLTDNQPILKKRFLADGSASRLSETQIRSLLFRYLYESVQAQSITSEQVRCAAIGNLEARAELSQRFRRTTKEFYRDPAEADSIGKLVFEKARQEIAIGQRGDTRADAEERFYRWMSVTAINIAKNYRDRAKTNLMDPLTWQESRPDTRGVSSMLKQYSSTARHIVCEKMEGRSLRSIARSLGVPQASVWRKWQTVVARLRKSLETND